MRVAVTSLAIVLLGSAWIGAMSLTTQDDRADAWASGNVPTVSTLEELAAYPEAYRARIVKSLPPEVKSRFWRQQIAAFLATDPSLSQPQRTYLESMIQRATPEAMQSSGAESGVCEEFRKMFPDHRVAPIAKSGNLGAFANPRYTWQSRLVQAKELLVASITVHAEASCKCYNAGWCECSGLDECCQNIGSRRACTATTTGCGCWWEDDHGCNGLCMNGSACGLEENQ